MRAIRDIVRALNISHARMEQGNMRADVNVSLRNSPVRPVRHSFRNQERELVPRH